MTWAAAARRGDWPAAFAISDAVLRARDPAGRDDPSLPYHLRWVWDGRPFDGRAVLVRCYHGLGDTLHFSRFLPALAAVARHVTVEAPPALVPLLRRLPAPLTIHSFDPADPLPPAECDIESMELAHALRLAPDDVEPATLRGRVPPAGDNTGIGLCWRGGDWDARRSVPAGALAPIEAAAAGRLWSLQPGEGGPAFRNPGGCTADLLDTAGLLAGLARVVTIDSMIAHLAGVLGIPATVLLHSAPDWRWGETDAAPALYPTHRTLRQAIAGDWTSVVARAAVLLVRDHPPGRAAGRAEGA